MNGLLPDLRYALRQLRKSPGFTAVAVLTLALGIGANTAIFNLINSIMLRTLAVKDPQRLVLLQWKAKSVPQTKGSSSYDNCPLGSGPLLEGHEILSDVPLESEGCSFSYLFFKQVQAERRVFSDVGAFSPAEFSVNFAGRTIRARALRISGSFFPTLGVRAGIGRLLDEGDDSEAATPSVVVSDRFWRREFAADPSIVGKQILIGKTLFTVAGVTGPEYPELDPGVLCDVWVPFAFMSKLPPYRPGNLSASGIWMELIGRLHPGVSVQQANSALGAAFVASTTRGPEAIFKAADAPRVELSPASRGLATLRRNFSRPLFTLLAAVAIVLLISCANLAGLMLARSISRRQELGMRIALGASRQRLIRQMLTESLLLSFVGGAIGILMGHAGACSLASFLSNNFSVPLRLHVQTDPGVLAFAVSVSVLVGVGVGLVPALTGGRKDGLSALKQSADSSSAGVKHRRAALSTSLVAIQVALAMLVLTATGLVVRTWANLTAEDVGFDPQNLLVFSVDSSYSNKDPETLYHELQGKLSRLPGVASVSRSGISLLSNEGVAGPIFSEDRLQKRAQAHLVPMSADFLSTMRIPLRLGRALNEQEAEEAHPRNVPIPAVVNKMLAQRFFGNENPLGGRFRALNATGPEYQVVGVIPDVRYGNLRDPIWPTVYAPVADWNGEVYFEVRTTVVPEAVIPEVGQAVRKSDPTLLITGMKTEMQQINEDIYQERLISYLSTCFAGLALAVACIGIFGLLSFQVERQTHEIGIRLALGASPRNILRAVLRQATTLAVVGALAGSAAALVVTRYLRSLLFGVDPTDPLTLIVVGLLLVATAMAASFIPARRAAKVDPMVALRYE